MSTKTKKSKKKKASKKNGTKSKNKRDPKITALADKLNLDLKPGADNRAKKKAKLKFTKFEKCPGYEYISKAEKLEAEKKYKPAIKLYELGCEQLEHYTKHNIDNALEKRSRMERIQGYRQRSLKLQNAALVQKKSKTKAVTKSKYPPFEDEEGYKIVQQAIKHQNNHKLDKAIQSYEKGLTMLERDLPSITDSKEKEHRRNKVREWRSEQQWCRNQLDHAQHNRTKHINNKSKQKKNKHRAYLDKEPGYILCKKAEQYEKDKKYDAATTHYQKGIPMLEDTMLYNTDSSSQKRERMKHIETYRHKLQSLKNRKIRRKSLKFKAAKIPATLRTAKRSSSARREMTGGVLYKNIRQGTLSVDVIKFCSRLSMYYMLPIVASSIMHAPLPFQSFIGDPLLEAMTAKIEISGSLEQRLRFFLYSYSEIDIVQALWGDHPAMPTVIDVSDLMNDGEEDDDKEEEDDAFEESYVEKDAVLFFRKVALSNYPSVHQEILIDSTYCAVYDVMGKDQTIDKIRIEKIFKSNAKPLLVSAWQKQSDRKYKQISTFIIKYGDDVRLDAGAQHMFRFFNSIWSEEGLFYEGYAVQCLLYQVVPMGKDCGAIEFIPGCKPMRDVCDYFGTFGTAQKQNLVASAAGSYIASFVLGVRDRHFDNVLIQDDGTLFHIDFGYVMGAKLLMDTSKIAITTDLCKLFEDHWESFVETAVNAFMTLRLHYQEILDYSDLVFDFVDLDVNSSEFLYRMLKMHETDDKAEGIMRHKIANAPSSWNTKIKNAAHYVATL